MLDKAPNKKLSDLLDTFGAALAAGDIDKAVALFPGRLLLARPRHLHLEHQDHGRPRPGARHAEEPACRRPSRRTGRSPRARTRPKATALLEGWISFETEVARGFGHIRLKDGKIWTLLTTMVELKGHEEPAGFDRPLGAKHGRGKNRPTWKEEREKEAAELGFKTQPYALIIGGGQGGIALGARLRQLGVPTIIVEKNERAGDSWRKRYKSLCLHDPVWYDHLPYIDFPEELAGLLAQGQDRRLAGNVHQGDGAELLVLDRGQERHL